MVVTLNFQGWSAVAFKWITAIGLMEIAVLVWLYPPGCYGAVTHPGVHICQPLNHVFGVALGIAAILIALPDG